MNTVLYSGDGTSNRGITGTGFQPDLVVNKGRTFSAGAYNWYTFDSVRTLGARINWNTSAAEDDKSAEFISFDSDGFTVTNNAGSLNMNGSGVTYANFCWKADNTSGSSNTDGDITSTVATNTTAGFSIVKYTGNGNASTQTVGHGLGSKCKLVILKNLTDAESWRVYHDTVSASAGGNLFLNSTSSLDTSDPARITATSTSTFTLSGYTSTYDAVNKSGSNYIAYCFSEVKGYSNFGSYEGNGNADGTFIYTGFKPAFFLIKNADGANGWVLWDSKRETYNPNNRHLFPHDSSAESTSGRTIDFLSNGVKIRTTDGATNTNANTFIYMCFAEQTLVGTNKVCATAR